MPCRLDGCPPAPCTGGGQALKIFSPGPRGGRVLYALGVQAPLPVPPRASRSVNITRLDRLGPRKGRAVVLANPIHSEAVEGICFPVATVLGLLREKILFSMPTACGLGNGALSPELSFQQRHPRTGSGPPACGSRGPSPSPRPLAAQQPEGKREEQVAGKADIWHRCGIPLGQRRPLR